MRQRESPRVSSRQRFIEATRQPSSSGTSNSLIERPKTTFNLLKSNDDDKEPVLDYGEWSEDPDDVIMLGDDPAFVAFDLGESYMQRDRIEREYEQKLKRI